VHLGLEANADHVERVAYALLVVDDEGLRNHVEDFAVHGYHDGASRLDDPVHVLARYLPAPARHRDDAPGIDALDARAGGAAVDVPYLAPGHELRGLDRRRDRGKRGLDVDHDATAQAVEGATPTPIISRTPFSLYSPTTARAFVVPMSRPTIGLSARLSLLAAVHHRAGPEIYLLHR
jgi:hypothetical protein